MNEKSLMLAVFALLERENTVSIPQIAHLLGTDEETVWNVLEDLVFCYDTAGLRLDLRDNFAHLMRSRKSQVLRLTRDETDILLDALEAQGFSASDELVTKLLQTKGFLASADADADKTGAPAPNPKVRTVNRGTVAPLLEMLATACEDSAHHLLEIEYQAEGAASAETRVVEPHAITSEGDYRYLQAFCLERDAWRTFRIDRIRSAQQLEGTFVPREPEAASPTTTARIRFAAGWWPQSWPDLRRVRELEDGSTEGRIPWLGGMWLPKHIVAMGGNAVVIDPPELAAAVRTYAHQLLDE